MINIVIPSEDNNEQLVISNWKLVIIFFVIPRRGNVVDVGRTTLLAPTWGSTAVFHLAERD